MRFDLDTRRPITDDEACRGLKYLQDNKFGFFNIAGGKLRFWQRDFGDVTIVVNSPINGWWGMAFVKGMEITESCANHSECEEMVNDLLAEARFWIMEHRNRMEE